MDFIAQEYCYHGDFFDLVAKSEQFDEQIAKFYFKQLVEALDYCHSQGIYHMDVKLNIIALDENFGIKIIDFGSAVDSKGNDKCTDLMGVRGSPSF